MQQGGQGTQAGGSHRRNEGEPGTSLPGDDAEEVANSRRQSLPPSMEEVERLVDELLEAADAIDHLRCGDECAHKGLILEARAALLSAIRRLVEAKREPGEAEQTERAHKDPAVNEAFHTLQIEWREGTGGEGVSAEYELIRAILRAASPKEGE